MHRQLLLLGLLRREDMHGYQLNEYIERDLAFCADVKKPTAYYLLDRLAEEGHIAEVEEGQTPGGRPPRKTYRITPHGERAFLALLRENLRVYERPAFAGDIGVAFLDALPPGEALGLLGERRAAMQRQLDELREVPGHGGALRLVIEHHIIHLEAELAWLERVIEWLAGQTNE